MSSTSGKTPPRRRAVPATPAQQQRQERARQYRGSSTTTTATATKSKVTATTSRGGAGARAAGTKRAAAATAAATDESPTVRASKRLRVSAPASPSPSASSPGAHTLSSTRRCCKADLTRCLAEGELLELLRVDQYVLDEHNGGEPIRARFADRQLVDVSTKQAYRSVSKWVKQRLIDVGALSPNSNISGWDWVAVNRNGVLTSLRLLSGASASPSPSAVADVHESDDGASVQRRYRRRATATAAAAPAPSIERYASACAERDALRAECEKLRSAIMKLAQK